MYAPFDVLCDIAEDLNLRLPTVKNDIEVTVWYVYKHIFLLARQIEKELLLSALASLVCTVFDPLWF